MICLSEEQIRSLLNWDDTFKATEASMKAVSSNNAQLAERTFTSILNTPKWMTTMPGYLDDEKYGGWACKILSGNPENAKRSTPMCAYNASVILLDENTGALKAVLAGVELTDWRTAAASAVATKYLHTSIGKPQQILSIFGCGNQGKAHAECFYQCFKFEEIRLWNRTTQRATNLSKKLNEKFDTTKFKVFEETENCAKGADVIITTTNPSSAPIVKHSWLKQGIHINAVGVATTSSNDDKNFELDEETYKNAYVFVDSWKGANTELNKLKEFGATMKAEVGEVILGKSPMPNRQQLTVFQSLGMAAEDCAMARLIYDLYFKNENNTISINKSKI